MLVRAHLRFLPIAPRKVRLVIDLVRGLPVNRALDQLEVLPKRSARPIAKLIKSAVANATNNFHLESEGLRIKSIVANEGPRLKRYRPRAFGRAALIAKKLSHVTVVLEDQAKSIAPKKGKPEPAAKSTPTVDGQRIEKPVKRSRLATAVAKPANQTEVKSQQRRGTDHNIIRQGTN